MVFVATGLSSLARAEGSSAQAACGLSNVSEGWELASSVPKSKVEKRVRGEDKFVIDVGVGEETIPR